MMKRISVIVSMLIAHMVYGQEVVPGSLNVVSSPSQKYMFTIFQKEDPEHHRKLYYMVKYKGHTIVNESLLDLELDNSLSEKAMALPVDKHRDWCENLKITGSIRRSVDSSWVTVCGERTVIKEKYNGLTIETVKDDNPIYRMNIEIRVSDDGLAFRYYFPENPKGTYYNIVAEHTEFCLPEHVLSWFTNWGQGAYEKLPLENWKGESERPLLLEMPDSVYVVLTEAAMTDYARTKFMLKGGHTLMTSMSGSAQLISPFGTPWRVIMAADHPGDLIEHDDWLLSLNRTNQIADASWIRPGKQIRVMQVNTASAKENIDFAVDRGLQYILFDWKWYGPPFSFGSDASKVAIPDLSLPEVIAYARSRKIGVWLYVNQQAMLAQSDSLFAIYHKWGVAGVKIGFVQVGSHRWTTWAEEMIRKAAENHILLDIHDDWRPTGEQRTWPNLLTAEGVRGNEEMPDATHNTILPFTRFLAGPADYTICYFDKRIKTTHAHQLALSVIYFSPLQTLYWYDSPASFHGEPELQFWKEVPTTWDETKVLCGIPGQYIVTARRKNKDWFIGGITNNSPRALKISLDFLGKDQKYAATIYHDEHSFAQKNPVGIKTAVMTSGSMITLDMAGSGGVAISLKALNLHEN